MELNKKLIWKESVDNTISDGGNPETGKLINPNPGVAYVQETDYVYFNNVCLPQNVTPGPGPGPRTPIYQELG